jgi:uncharacterized protein
MTQKIKTEEPSIDEVLTRIRRVIGDDNAAKIAERVSESAAPPQSQIASYSVPPAANSRTDEQAPTPETVRGSVPYVEAQGELISKETKVTVNSAFNALAKTVLRHNSQTLENMFREILRPILKAWLDDKLSNMVERLVRAEIERVSNVGPGVRPTSR